VTRYYLAARYSRHAEMRRYRDELVAAIPGATVTSRWIDQHAGKLESSFTPEVLAADPAGCWVYGAHDLVDLDEADVVVSFTGAGGGGKGGRHVEFGYALAACKPLVIVGPRENIFHCHPDIEVYPTWADFLRQEPDR